MCWAMLAFFPFSATSIFSFVKNHHGYKYLVHEPAETSVQEVQQQVNTNIVGLVTCAREALKSMVANKTEGTIININSVLGHMDSPLPATAVYAATKHAVGAITSSLRSEVSMLKANVRVTSLSPGAVKSEMSDSFLDKSKPAKEQMEVLPAEDISDCVLYILQAPQRMTISELTVHCTSESVLSIALAAAKMVQNLKV